MLLISCQNAETISAPITQASGISSEAEDSIMLIDGIPCLAQSREPLLRLSEEIDPDTLAYDLALMRWIGRGGQPYQLRRLRNASYTVEQIEKMTPQDAASLHFSIDGAGPSALVGLSDSSKEALFQLGLEEDVLDGLLRMGIPPEVLIGLDTEKRAKLIQLYTPISEIDQKFEDMGLTHGRQTTMEPIDCLITALSQPDDVEFRSQAENQGIPHWEQDALLKRGHTRLEILEMTPQQRKAALIPATNTTWFYHYQPRDKWSLNDTGQAYLLKRGIPYEMEDRLRAIGYNFYDMITMSDTELDLLLPLEDLPQKLNDAGFSDETIASLEPQLKYIVQEVLDRNKADP